ncbi:adenylate kinase [Sinomonas albida]|uniref:adenylate kinase n=1 Tax=Sinomonas albida TaxID=369942 RepID=UPI00301826F6
MSTNEPQHPNSVNRFLIMGPPGVGKGTQAERLAKHFSIPTISTGSLFREHVRNGTPLGLEIRELLAMGRYVSDEITNTVVAERLTQPDAEQGFILDGYPRTLAQVDALDAILAQRSAELDAVIVLEADHDQLIERILLRAVEQDRSDDTPEVVAHRLGVYSRETAQLISAYDARGLVVRVDGTGLPHVVADRITEALRAL